MQSRASSYIAFVSAVALATTLSACAGGTGSAPASNIAPDTSAGALPGLQSSGVQRNAFSADTITSAKDWNVQAGASTLDQAFQNLDFYANSITVDVGDRVTWRIASQEGHTVSFLAPGQSPPAPTSPQATQAAGTHSFDGTTFTSSGLLTDGQNYTLTFLKPGTYKYYCLIHRPAMSGTIVVQKTGTPYPHDQAFYTHAGEEDEWVDLNAGESSVEQFPFKSGGTTISAGIAPGLATGKPSQSTVMRFVDTNDASQLGESRDVTVSAGTTVTWVGESNNEPHTITFPAGHPLPANPFVPPSGGPTFDGSTFTNSGILFPGQKYSLKFTKPGSYVYLCLLHHDEGMTGRVIVK